MPIANINGVNLNYEVAGQGEAVVFIHGHTGSTQDWANQKPVLSPRYKVVTLDLRGHGKSAVPSREEEYSIEIFAEDVFGLLKMLNIRKCCLGGHSVGGFTALQFALEHQDMLAALVLVDTSGGLYSSNPGYSYVNITQKVVELVRSQGKEAAFEYETANRPGRMESFQKHPELREVAWQKFLQTSVDGYLYVARASGKRGPVTDRLSQVKVPTLICWGEEDFPFAKGVQVLNEGIAGSELVAFKGSGHSPHEEVPEAFNEALLKFLNKINW